VLREKIYMHLNKEIPYNVRQKTQLLGVDAKTGVLVCEQDLIVSTRSHQVLAQQLLSSRHLLLLTAKSMPRSLGSHSMPVAMLQEVLAVAASCVLHASLHASLRRCAMTVTIRK
jgi:hypothetical protein